MKPGSAIGDRGGVLDVRAAAIRELLRSNESGPRRQKLAASLAQRIVADINRRQLAPGAMLPREDEMLAHYKVGRFTLRESLRYLEMQGLISIKPGPRGGPVVNVPEPRSLAIALSLGLQFTGTKFAETLETRQALEPVVAALAAERIDPDMLDDLRDSVETMGAALDRIDVFLEENERFHDIIAWSSGNSTFGYLLSALHLIGDGTALGVRYPDWARKVVFGYHKKIYEAIASKNSTAAHDIMKEHIDQYVRYMEDRYPGIMSTPVSWDRGFMES